MERLVLKASDVFIFIYLKKIMIILAAVIATLVVLFISIGYYLSAPVYQGPVSDHFTGKEFINPGGVKAKGLGEVLQWMVKREQGPWTEIKDNKETTLPTERIDSGLHITFINHTTFLIQVDGINILTDPVWSERTSPFTWAGPKRMRQPGVKMEDLPPIDFIVLSHNHYDHLDITTVQELVKKHQPKIITPLGVKAFLHEEEIKGVQDMDWWDEKKLTNNISIQAVPAQHFSGRGMFDRDKTLWCGYIFKRKTGNLYFAGDTGYNETTFKEIGEKCAPIQVSILPIGAYKPTWFMQNIHTSPEDAVKIFVETKTEWAVASHFGTFPLADDGQTEPIEELKEALNKYKINPEKFLPLREGSKLELK
ncbi:MAG: MBL fold metallo-hydrolase [Chryseotalea sp.]|jgi:L-ascorbate metabolism protein UlaG (beta-lactamase superfamily)